jgi:PA-IL-like protein
MIRRLVMAAVLAMSTAAAGLAATQATLILRNGERHTGTLVYRKDANFNVIENGQERSFPQSEVAVIDLAGGTPSADELNKLPASDNPSELERNTVILRNGSAVAGKLYNINENDSITIDTREGQRRDIPLSEIARIYANGGSARSVFRDVATGTTGTPVGRPAPVPGAVMVEANRQWNDTGITVKRGDRVAFRTTGTISYGPAADMTSNPDGSAAPNAPRGPQFPVSEVPVGALIGRVGNGTPFPIGTNSSPIAMPADGRLYLGVNDDNYGDNSGAFAVVVTTQRRR